MSLPDEVFLRMQRAKRWLVGPRDFVQYEATVSVAGLQARFPIERKGDEARILQMGGERENIEAIVAAVGEEDVFWDVGSYLGLITVLAAKRSIRGRVVSVEPDPGCAIRLKKHVALNGLSNVDILHCGLGDHPGELALNTSGGYGDAPSFFDKNLKSNTPVPVRTIDSIVQERSELAPTIMKIDVEGFELRVLRGAKSTLLRPVLRAIFLEVHPVVMTKERESLAEMHSILETSGFQAVSCCLRKNEMHFRFDRVSGA